MSAKTGMTKRRREKALSQIPKIVLEQMSYAHAGKRSDTCILAMREAAQGFKENDLIGVIRRPRAGATIEQMSPVLNMRWTDVPGLPEKYAKYFRERGVRYVVEFCYVQATRRSPTGFQLFTNMWEWIENNLGIPQNIDPLALGFRPEYWDDPLFQQMLNADVVEVLHGVANTSVHWDLRKTHKFGTSNQLSRWYHLLGVHYGGQLLAHDRDSRVERGGASSKWLTGKLKAFQRELRSGSLWAAALVPSEWAPPEASPRTWTADKALMQQEIEAIKEERQRRIANDWAERDSRRQAQPDSKIPFESVAEVRAVRPDLLITTVDVLEISIPTALSLQKAGLTTFELVIPLSTRQLLSDGLSRKSIADLNAALAGYGLKTGMRLKEPSAHNH